MHRSPSDELCAQAHAPRGLARALVGGQHADDLVQDAAVAALGRRAPPASLRAWLARVLRHLAGKHHRAARRRARHEGRAAEPRAPLPPDRLAEQCDALQRVTGALLALQLPPEWYR
jgi:DNA-directed RNA polymerase specialized sigma24 family protein